MTKRVLAILLVLVLLPVSALAARQYIIPDSDTRALTWDELLAWDYDSLGYIFNEIFARHGYNFNPGEKYDNFFSARPWYVPNVNDPVHHQVYAAMTKLENSNVDLVKAVRAYMRDIGDYNPGGMHYSDYIEQGNFDLLSGFAWADIGAGQQAAVYSAPSTLAWRGANGKASVSSNGAIYVAGWDSGWLLICYETNKGAIRVGYVSSGSLSGSFNAPMLQFQYAPATLNAPATLTDDPATTFSAICTLSAGTSVTYLTSFQNRYDWAYVETYVNGQQVRGFIPARNLNMPAGKDE